MPLITEALPAKRKTPFFYGWWIVIVNFMADFMAVGVGVYAFAVFVVPMSGALGWSRAAISFAPSLRTLVAGLMGPVVGPFIDRRNGARIAMTAGVFLAGLALMLCSLVQAPGQFYLTFGVLGAMGMATSSFNVGSALIAKWFIRKRGRALAFAGVGISAGGVLLVPLTRIFMDAFGWRWTWVLLGLVYWALVLPWAALLIRRQPEDLGLLPDGVVPAAESGSPGAAQSPLVPEERAWTRQEAVRTPTAWLIIVAFNLHGFAAITILVHEVAYFQSIGISAGMAAVLFTVTAFFGALGKVGWGFLAERVDVRACIIAGFVICMTALAAVLLFTTTAGAWFFAVFIGLGWGGFAVLQGLLWAQYFGRAHLGAIRGFFAPFNMISSIVGPVAAGFLYDLQGNYQFALSLLLVTWTIAIAVMLMVRVPRVPELRVSPAMA